MNRLVLFLFLLATSSALAGPVTAGDTTYPETIAVAGRSLKLVGAGLREVSFLKIDIYSGAIYAENRSCELRRLATDDQARVFYMDFLRDVPAKKLHANMRKLMDDATPADASDALKQQVDEFVSIFNEDGKKGRRAEVRYVPGTGLTVLVDGRQRGPVFPGAEFANVVFATWFGKKACCPDLLEDVRNTCKGL